MARRRARPTSVPAAYLMIEHRAPSQHERRIVGSTVMVKRRGYHVVRYRIGDRIVTRRIPIEEKALLLPETIRHERKNHLLVKGGGHIFVVGRLLEPGTGRITRRGKVGRDAVAKVSRVPQEKREGLRARIEREWGIAPERIHFLE